MTHERDDERKCTFVLEHYAEDTPLKDNLCAHEGDDECYQWVRDQLAQGNVWAWCVAKVTALLDDGRYGTDHLGGCSYKDEEDFKTGGYYDDMKDEAYNHARHCGK
jgi:hypothetical protein